MIKKKMLTEHGEEINDFMSQLNAGKEYIRRNQPLLEGLKARVESISTPDLSKERVQTSPPKHAMFTADAEYIADMETILDGLPTKLDALEEQIRNMIAKDEDVTRRFVLSSKFIENKSYREIADILAEGGYSKSCGTVYRWAADSMNDIMELPEDPIYLNLAS